MSVLIASFDDELAVDEALSSLYGEGFKDEEVRVMGDGARQGIDAPSGVGGGAERTGVAVPAAAGPDRTAGGPVPALDASLLRSGFWGLNFSDDEIAYFTDIAGRGGRVVFVRAEEERLEVAREILAKAGSTRLSEHG